MLHFLPSNIFRVDDVHIVVYRVACFGIISVSYRAHIRHIRLTCGYPYIADCDIFIYCDCTLVGGNGNIVGSCAECFCICELLIFYCNIVLIHSVAAYCYRYGRCVINFALNGNFRFIFPVALVNLPRHRRFGYHNAVCVFLFRSERGNNCRAVKNFNHFAVTSVLKFYLAARVGSYGITFYNRAVLQLLPCGVALACRKALRTEYGPVYSYTLNDIGNFGYCLFRCVIRVAGL